jgi:AcrR family transcriptional regulator
MAPFGLTFREVVGQLTQCQLTYWQYRRKLDTVSSHQSETVQPETRTRILKATWQLVEARRGQGVRMGDIAKAAGISRQALYLHFTSRADLLIATTHYVDEVRGLHERNRHWREAQSGLEKLDAYVAFWANYIPEIYGLGKALLAVHDADEAAAAAWDDRMASLRSGCRQTIEALYQDGQLASEWTREAATDIFWTLLSVRNWEQLTVECGWSQEQYITQLRKLLRKTLVSG